MSDAIRAALEASRDYLADCICMGQSYGYFPGGDPRDFEPDVECCTEEEMAAHKKACAEWDAGEQTKHEAHRHDVSTSADGKVTVSMSVSGAFGMGSYTIHDPMAEAAMALVVAALETLPNGDGRQEKP